MVFVNNLNKPYKYPVTEYNYISLLYMYLLKEGKETICIIKMKKNSLQTKKNIHHTIYHMKREYLHVLGFIFDSVSKVFRELKLCLD